MRPDFRSAGDMGLAGSSWITGKKVGWLAFLMMIVDLGALLIGQWRSTLPRSGRAPLAEALGVIAMSTMRLPCCSSATTRAGKGGFDKGSVRLAIAGSFVVRLLRPEPVRLPRLQAGRIR